MASWCVTVALEETVIINDTHDVKNDYSIWKHFIYHFTYTFSDDFHMKWSDYLNMHVSNNVIISVIL